MRKIFSRNNILGFMIIILMIGASLIFKDKEIILPELAALTVGCLVYKNPVWLSKPLHIFLLPSITAIMGFLVNKLDVSLANKFIVLLPLMFLLLRLFKSNLAPALATGLLPVITNSNSYSFIISILVLTLLLFIGLKFEKSSKDEVLPPHSPHPKHTALYLLMVSGWIIICAQLDWMFMAAIPPVIVIGFESIHKAEYNFSLFKRQVVSLFFAALIGTQALYFIDNLFMVALVDFAAITLVLKLLKFRLPPAYAMAILPMVLHHFSYTYFPLQVLMMSIIILGIVYIYRNNQLRYRLAYIMKRNN